MPKMPPLLATKRDLRYVASLPMPPTSSPALGARRCEQCGAVLSIYNPGDVCRPCQDKLGATSGDFGLPFGDGCPLPGHFSCFTCQEKDCRDPRKVPGNHTYSQRNDLIRQLASHGRSPVELGELFGLADSGVRRIINGNGQRRDHRA